ncbi:HEAT repeat domain-containing protein [Leptothermofonsia sp. ETS-13]|uniref:HEAT repeat domain-containing protein n=1 Tax=Leptothermofonsia sp. ETS-13 TaxID=3035696 RepID=UPI003BA10DC8
MPKSSKLEETLELLGTVRNDPTSEAAIATLRQVIKSRYSIAVAQAARIVGDAEIYSLVPDLIATFDQFMVKPVETDANCHAKFRIAETLYRLNYGEEHLFLRGIRHVQMEPVWGGRQDTAVNLRGICALGLVGMNYPDVMVELADLLADSEPPARVAAARAIAYSENTQGVPLLRLKVRIGDKEPQVLSECFAALLKLAPSQSVSLIAGFLASPEEQIQEIAALALGESRLREAFEILQRWWERTNQAELRRAGLLAIALLRYEDALEFLLALIAEGRSRDAKDAIAALSIYQQDEILWQKVCKSVEERGEAGLQQALKELRKEG